MTPKIAEEMKVEYLKSNKPSEDGSLRLISMPRKRDSSSIPNLPQGKTKREAASSSIPPTDQVRMISDLFWQFHNDRLKNHELTEMKPYIQSILDLISRNTTE